MSYKGVIASVVPHSIASEIGLEPGDSLLAVNDKQVTDIIDLSFLLAEEYLEILIKKANGEEELIEIEKDYDEDLGIEFESAVFNGVRGCANNCVFCFVDQMPQGMRNSLYVKDDDYRLSFLYGNFITLTNLTSRDLERISELRLSPLYVSVHTTNGKLRAQMLNNKQAAGIMEQLRQLNEIGVEMHTQIVLCPGFNDGEELRRTLSDLCSLYPAVASVGIVPVGLTQFRQACPAVGKVSREVALETIDLVYEFQKKMRNEHDLTFTYLADEFYILANQPIPAAEYYDGFPQLENGIGIVRSFISEWEDQTGGQAEYSEPKALAIICGVSAAKILEPLLQDLRIKNLTVRIIPVINEFFGDGITVTGLLTGKDIIAALAKQTIHSDGIIIPGIALKKGDNIFLDNIAPQRISELFGIPVQVAYSAGELRELLEGWR